MKNKKMKFPIASILFAMYAVFASLRLLQPYLSERYISCQCLSIAGCIFICIALIMMFMKKTDILLLPGILVLLPIKINYLITAVKIESTVHIIANILVIIACIILSFIVFTEVFSLPEKVRAFNKKIFFLPSLILFIVNASDIVLFILSNELNILSYLSENWDNIARLLTEAIAFFMLARWITHHYVRPGGIIIKLADSSTTTETTP